MTAYPRTVRAGRLCLDQAGRITAAYRFSATATAHLVQIADGGAYAMCAIDALGSRR